jgi:MOSC domain-containing protein YiiM
VDLQTLRVITAYRGRQESELGRGANFGVYADVVEPGTISVGDTLAVRAQGLEEKSGLHPAH